MSIHSTAIVHPGAQLHPTVEVGPYAIIGGKVRIGAGTTVGAHAVIDHRTTLGERNRIFPHAMVGGLPQDLKYAGEDTELVIGDENTIRELATLHIGTAGGGGVTRVGNRNLIMAYCHVAHDCQIGDGNIFSNNSQLAGHVTVEDHVICAGMAAIHQFVRIGKHAMIAGGSMVVMDVAPYCMAQGDRAELAGLNTVGLQRHGFDDQRLAKVKEAYRILFRAKLGLQEAVATVKAEVGSNPDIDHLLNFIAKSTRGLTR